MMFATFRRKELRRVASAALLRSLECRRSCLPVRPIVVAGAVMLALLPATMHAAHAFGIGDVLDGVEAVLDGVEAVGSKVKQGAQEVGGGLSTIGKQIGKDVKTNAGRVKKAVGQVGGGVATIGKEIGKDIKNNAGTIAKVSVIAKNGVVGAAGVVAAPLAAKIIKSGCPPYCRFAPVIPVESTNPPAPPGNAPGVWGARPVDLRPGKSPTLNDATTTPQAVVGRDKSVLGKPVGKVKIKAKLKVKAKLKAKGIKTKDLIARGRSAFGLPVKLNTTRRNFRRKLNLLGNKSGNGFRMMRRHRR